MTPSFCPTPEITVKFNDWLKVEEIKVKSLQKKKKKRKNFSLLVSVEVCFVTDYMVNFGKGTTGKQFSKQMVPRNKLEEPL